MVTRTPSHACLLFLLTARVTDGHVTWFLRVQWPKKMLIPRCLWTERGGTTSALDQNRTRHVKTDIVDTTWATPPAVKAATASASLKCQPTHDNGLEARVIALACGFCLCPRPDGMVWALTASSEDGFRTCRCQRSRPNYGLVQQLQQSRRSRAQSAGTGRRLRSVPGCQRTLSELDVAVMPCNSRQAGEW